MNPWIRKLMTLTFCGLLLFGTMGTLTGCKDNNNAEDAAEEVQETAEEAAEETGEVAEDAAEEAGDAAEEAGDAVEQALD